MYPKWAKNLNLILTDWENGCESTSYVMITHKYMFVEIVEEYNELNGQLEIIGFCKHPSPCM